MIYPKQVRAARSLLGISQTDLADRANVGVATVKRIEGTVGELRVTVEALIRVQRALEADGIVFIESDETLGLGVRFRDPSAT